MAESPPPAALLNEDVLLTTKLFIPQPRHNYVSRPDLVEQLNESLRRGCKLTTVTAPPGFGKTTLLSEWLWPLSRLSQPGSKVPARPGTAVAWLTLDEADNEPRRFYAYCLAALQTILPGLSVSMPARQISPTTFPQSLLSALINKIAVLPQKVVFVLDDYHLIESGTIHNGLAFVLEHLPPQVQLVIASRTEVPLPLARLRAQGELTEIHSSELRFSAAEAALFLEQTMGLALSAADVAVLEARTEGWIAGLQMAALSLHGVQAQDVAEVVKGFGGSHRYVLDYLLEEVLQKQPQHLQTFLLKTSILDRLCGPLCEAVVLNGAADQGAQQREALQSGQTRLEYLEQANLFIIPLDDERHWYRYHHLFADLLRHRLLESLAARSVDEGKVALAELHRRASIWFEQHGLATEAVRHALAAVDIKRVIRLAKQKAATLLSRGELMTVLGWLDALPDELMRSRPGVSLLRAWALILTGQLNAVESHLQLAEQEAAAELLPEGQPDISGEVAALRATAAYFQRDMARTVDLCQQALARLSPDNLFLTGIVTQMLGAAYGWQGRAIEAAQVFKEASVITRSAGQTQIALQALWSLGELYIEQGYLQQAAETFRQGIWLVEQQAASEREILLPMAGRLYIGWARVLYEWNEIEAAATQLATGLNIGQTAREAATLISGYLLQARLSQLEMDYESARQALYRADQEGQPYFSPFYWTTQVAIYQARLWLAQDNLRAVAAWVQERGLQLEPPPAEIPYLHEDEYLVLVRLLLAQVDWTGADRLLPVSRPLALVDTILAQMLVAARSSARTGRVIEGLALQALRHHVGHQGSALALTTLQEALAMAEPEGYLRLFVDEGRLMIELLQEAASQRIAPDYVATLLAGAGQPDLPQPAELLDPLSERELEILGLIATGMSNKELAGELVLTVGTVKWHLNNLYSKLSVRNRTEAVAKARTLGLL